MYAIDAVRPRLRGLVRAVARPLPVVFRTVSLVTGIVLVTSGEPTGNEVLVRYAGVLLLTFGPLLPLWRAPERDTPGPLRVRQLLRRAVWRTAVLLAAGAWAAGIAGLPVLGWCLAAAAPVLPIAEPWAWLLFPAELRRDAAVGRAMEECQRSRRDPAVFHPEQGAAGRPAGIRTRPRPEEVAPRKSVRTVSPRSSFGYPALLWTGNQLVLHNQRGRARRVPAACAEIVHVRGLGEQRVQGSPGSTTEPARLGAYEKPRNTRAVYLLDRDGYRLARVPGPWPARDRVAAVAHAAGLLFSAYDLTPYGDDDRITRLLFPYRRPRPPALRRRS